MLVVSVVTVQVTRQLGPSCELGAAVVTPQAPPVSLILPNLQPNLQLVPLCWLSRLLWMESAQMVEQTGLQVETSFTFLTEISLVRCDGFPFANTRILIKLEFLYRRRKIISKVDFF